MVSFSDIVWQIVCKFLEPTVELLNYNYERRQSEVQIVAIKWSYILKRGHSFAKGHTIKVNTIIR